MATLYTSTYHKIGNYGRVYGAMDYSTSNSETGGSSITSITLSWIGEAWTSSSSYSSTYEQSNSASFTGKINGSSVLTGSLTGSRSATVSSAGYVYKKASNLSPAGSVTINITRTTSTQSIPIIVQYTVSGTTHSGTTNITIPAKSSYKVTYNANGGTGAPASQTKWYGSTLTLSSTIPTRTNYNFLGWATSASATTPTYCTGPNHTEHTTYTGNSALSLYAVWELSYIPSTFTSMVAYRCDVDENLKDDGTYGYLSFAWEPGTYRGTSVYVKPIIKYKLNSDNTYTILDSLTISNNSVSVKIGSALNPLTEYQYDVLFILEDYDGPYDGSLINGRSSILINTITYATFISAIACVIDINADGSAIGLLSYVNDTDSGVFVKGTPLYAWTEIGSGSNPNSDPNFEIGFNDITNYNEVMIVADIERLNVHHLLTVSIPVGIISANSGSTTEIKLGGGQGVSAGTNCGAWGEITTTSFTPVAASINNTDYKASTSWYIYAR